MHTNFGFSRMIFKKMYRIDSGFSLFFLERPQTMTSNGSTDRIHSAYKIGFEISADEHKFATPSEWIILPTGVYEAFPVFVLKSFFLNAFLKVF